MQFVATNHEQVQAAAGGTQNSKMINPLKSRFCALNSAQPIGMQSMEVDEFSLSASSHSNEQVRPHLARLNLELGGGAWCPGKPISGSTFGKEWIQVKLNRSHVITALETQGRFGMGAGKEFVPSYTIEFSRNSGKSWHKWKDFRGSSLLRANEDVNSPVRNELSPPIVGANLVRILPYSQHLRTVCLRFELYGCPYEEGAPIAYATSEGVVELPRWGHLIDYTYDGSRLAGRLSGGLGQLVDGVLGPDNFAHNSGFEWVGWKSMNGDLEIEFTFPTLRNFSQALFHSNNLFSSGVEVFQALDVHFGIDHSLAFEPLRDAVREERRRDATLRLESDNNNPASSLDLISGEQPALGTLWSGDVLSIEYEPDKSSESARPVTVHLKQRLANKLKFVLKFASKWILLSEVEFINSRVELLTPTSLLSFAPEREQTLALLSALSQPNSQPTTYDQYLAIVREHQLRKAAASALMESFLDQKVSGTEHNHLPSTVQSRQSNQASPENSSSSNMISTHHKQQDADTSSSSSTSETSNYPADNTGYPADSTPTSQSANYPPLQDSGLNFGEQPKPSAADEFAATELNTQLFRPRLSGKHIPGPPIPHPNSFWHLAAAGSNSGPPLSSPASNPILSQFGPPLFGAPSPSSSINHGGILNRATPDLSGGARFAASPASSDLFAGPASAILLALVALLTLIGLLLLISNGRLQRLPFARFRRRPKLDVVASNLTGRSVISSSAHSTKSSGLHAFLNQVLHPTANANLPGGDPTRYTRNSPHSFTGSSHHHTPLSGVYSNANANLFAANQQMEPQQQQQHLYNVIYAKNDRHHHTPLSGILTSSSGTLPSQQDSQQHLYNVIYAKNDRPRHTPLSAGVFGGAATLPTEQQQVEPHHHQQQQHLYNVIYAKNDRHQHTHKPMLPQLPGQQQQLFNLL